MSSYDVRRGTVPSSPVKDWIGRLLPRVFVFVPRLSRAGFLFQFKESLSLSLSRSFVSGLDSSRLGSNVERGKKDEKVKFGDQDKGGCTTPSVDTRRGDDVELIGELENLPPWTRVQKRSYAEQGEINVSSVQFSWARVCVQTVALFGIGRRGGFVSFGNGENGRGRVQDKRGGKCETPRRRRVGKSKGKASRGGTHARTRANRYRRTNNHARRREESVRGWDGWGREEREGVKVKWSERKEREKKKKKGTTSAWRGRGKKKKKKRKKK
ncbi:hypothetical protein BXZ70DRAFT_910872 [Cristinia sonorae]|uniref:Uncharacterized protein n=1 Tax=Cristinia sonorae TaxID=1940300 RepID=A0A8K0UEA9_9AGAR|nr:hypothetical protein BXZ70DRAFT_910872 [Cristinia sonorae]